MRSAFQNFAHVWVPCPCVSAVSAISRNFALGMRFNASPGTERLRGLMKSSAELIHVIGTLMRSRFVQGL
jgi:hypothetical protein